MFYAYILTTHIYKCPLPPTYISDILNLQMAAIWSVNCYVGRIHPCWVDSTSMLMLKKQAIYAKGNIGLAFACHSWVYPLIFLFAKLRNPCPFIPIPTSGKKELTYYCAPYITTTHSHKKLKYWPTLGPDRVLGVPTGRWWDVLTRRGFWSCLCKHQIGCYISYIVSSVTSLAGLLTMVPPPSKKDYRQPYILW